MQVLKTIDADKVTYSTYYEALMKCKELEENEAPFKKSGQN